MIPQLPPKKLLKTGAHFIEVRQKALKRFLTLVDRHPNIYDHSLTSSFLTFLGMNVQHGLKEEFLSGPEFSTNKLAQTVEELVPLDTSIQSRLARDLMKQVHSSVIKLRDAAENIKEQSVEGALDMLTFGREWRNYKIATLTKWRETHQVTCLLHRKGTNRRSGNILHFTVSIWKHNLFIVT
ncbi:sorting nexin-8-like isoform X2 [Tachypleus tridentatus]|uniref:sorting nexin-8-like isoform X2 n=1 Tax=Tachypleus tridentatus TaxID=6853 RepID=UPI003FD5AED3